MKLSTIYNPIANELKQVDMIIREALQDHDNPNTHDILTHLATTSGKKVRAALTLFSYFSTCKHEKTNPKDHLDKALKLAASLELIHLASLVHDDIIDQSDTRRNQESVYKKWGSNASIITGVYIYAKALEIATSLQNYPILSNISTSVKELCEGEFNQVFGRNQLHYTLDTYLTMIKKKTAVLFASACYCGSLLGQNTPTVNNTFKQYGLELGIIFQITDDYLDLFGNHADLGKTPGQDIVSGEFTLPFYFLQKSLSTENQKKLIHYIETQSDLTLPFIQDHLTTEIETQTKHVITEYLTQCNNNLQELTPSHYVTCLEKITSFISDRCFKKKLAVATV